MCDNTVVLQLIFKCLFACSVISSAGWANSIAGRKLSVCICICVWSRLPSPHSPPRHFPCRTFYLDKFVVSGKFPQIYLHQEIPPGQFLPNASWASELMGCLYVDGIACIVCIPPLLCDLQYTASALAWPYTFCLGPVTPVLEECNKSERWWSGVAVARWSRSTKLTYVEPG